MKQISVRPVAANLTRDTEVIGKMDPYCVCILGTEKQQTKYKNEAGKEPKWDEQLIFLNTSGVTVMQVQVWDKDVTTSDLVGQGQIDLSSHLFGNGQPRNETVNIQYKGKSAGQVFLTISVRGVGGQQQQQGPYCNSQGVCFPGGQGGHGHGHGHGPQGGQGGW